MVTSSDKLRKKHRTPGHLGILLYDGIWTDFGPSTSVCREAIEQREQLDCPGSLADSPLSLGPVVWQGSPAPFF
ncbi:MAG: hypothetical protein CMJ89_19615 [Planctomycetes bacterium]|nr:hypothetical protein [Planctomycetota bacterium]